jgi:cation diffusion facilitator CzcD-associated flavoprotein CzcO
MDTTPNPTRSRSQQLNYDVVVVGAGLGGMYAIHKLRQHGLKVAGLETAAGVGGVWYHNRYPGARVDIRSMDYTFYFSSELFREWRWSERYAAQPELLAYLNYVADKFDIKRHFLFETKMTSAQWSPDDGRWHVGTSRDQAITCQFLIMATGSLSEARDPDFPGLEDYEGEWVQTSHWPQRDVRLRGRRIGVIGTGSSGIQAIPVIAESADHLYVFQRRPNFAVPAQNGPLEHTEYERICEMVLETRQHLFTTPGGQPPSPAESPKTAAECTPEEQEALLERQYKFGSQGIKKVFTDQNVSLESNGVVSDFVRKKIRERVNDQELAEWLCPYDHPIGTRRIALETNYYETYNRNNVTLVNLGAEPIERFTKTGLKTSAKEYELDLVVFALGFHAFTGALNSAGIRNHLGRAPTDHWDRGPRTAYGFMTNGFPNLFLVAGPGSPSVVANLFVQNEYQLDWIADLIRFLKDKGYKSVEPSEEAVEAWTSHCADMQGNHIKVQAANYQVQVCADGTRVMIPYMGGLGRHFEAVTKVAAAGYPGFIITPEANENNTTKIGRLKHVAINDL